MPRKRFAVPLLLMLLCSCGGHDSGPAGGSVSPDRATSSSIGEPAALDLVLPDRVHVGTDFSMQARLLDANGTPLSGSSPALRFPAGIRHLGGNLYRAEAIGPFEIATDAGGRRLAAILQVDGVAAYDGSTRLGLGQHEVPAERLRLENGRLRLRLSDTTTQRAGAVAEVATPWGWLEGTSLVYGDWTYPAAGVDTPPTKITVLVDRREVSFLADFDNHRFAPASLRYSADLFPEQPYPFTKQVVLREGEDGYFTRIIVRGSMPQEIWDAEHEVGFGGLWGGGSVTSNKRELDLSRLESNVRWNLDATPDAYLFERFQDPVRRTLVPLIRTPVITPKFSDTEFGAVYVHSHEAGTYAAYLHIEPPYRRSNAREVCWHAWLTAPFPVPEITDRLAGCGPQQ